MEAVRLDSEEISKFHLEEIARIHYSAYSEEHFTSNFSLKKLKEYYKELIISSDLSLFFTDEGRSIGFIIAGESISKGVSHFIKGNRSYIIFLLLTHPKFLLEKLTDILKSFLPSEKKECSKFRLMSIAVDSTIHSRGYGKRMLQIFEEYLKKGSHLSYGLSVRNDNEKGIRFYIDNGFVLEAETSDSHYYRKDLN